MITAAAASLVLDAITARQLVVSLEAGAEPAQEKRRNIVDWQRTQRTATATTVWVNVNADETFTAFSLWDGTTRLYQGAFEPVEVNAGDDFELDIRLDA